ncbi:MAG: large subunit ribosomal protein L6 [Parcubacteria group bacterium Gr01-1014_107]|nr:MAG: large subunit ribosomal protein L6 [Parcubacteria group bacterium Gr01-1014_107]
MSRIGKKPIPIPSKTEVKITNDLLTVKGPLGEISRRFRPAIKIEVTPGQVTLSTEKQDLLSKALWGTYASHIKNMIEGVNKPFEKKLVIEGIGFRAELKGKKLSMKLGFSHPVEIDTPEGLKVSLEKESITVSGIDKEKVGQFAASLRSLKKPEPYKGKGIRYADEVIRRKQGKKTI